MPKVLTAPCYDLSPAICYTHYIRTCYTAQIVKLANLITRHDKVILATEDMD